eukprot:5352186-Pyramimonas_sp.AAC.1
MPPVMDPVKTITPPPLASGLPDPSCPPAQRGACTAVAYPPDRASDGYSSLSRYTEAAPQFIAPFEYRRELRLFVYFTAHVLFI